MVTVSDVKIDDDYITVLNDQSIIEVAQEMAKSGVPDAVVVNDKNEVLGVLDDYDIVSKVLAEERDPKSVTAEEIMYAPPPVNVDSDLAHCHEIMEQLEASMLPVLDDDKKLLGVITIMDVLDGLMDQSGTGLLGRLSSLFGR